MRINRRPQGAPSFPFSIMSVSTWSISPPDKEKLISAAFEGMFIDNLIFDILVTKSAVDLFALSLHDYMHVLLYGGHLTPRSQRICIQQILQVSCWRCAPVDQWRGDQGCQHRERLIRWNDMRRKDSACEGCGKCLGSTQLGCL